MVRPAKRAHRMERLLDYLAGIGDDAQASSEIGEGTGLGDGALPLLADLVRRGWLEYCHQVRDGRLQLLYQVTDRGRTELVPRAQRTVD